MLKIGPTPRTTRLDTVFPYTTRFRSVFAAIPVDQCRHRIGKVGLRIGLRRAPLRFDENRPSRAQPPQGIVEPGGDGHEFGGRGTVEIGTAKARRALKRSVLVYQDQNRDV